MRRTPFRCHGNPFTLMSQVLRSRRRSSREPSSRSSKAGTSSHSKMLLHRRPVEQPSSCLTALLLSCVQVPVRNREDGHLLRVRPAVSRHPGEHLLLSGHTAGQAHAAIRLVGLQPMTSHCSSVSAGEGDPGVDPCSHQRAGWPDPEGSPSTPPPLSGHL